MRHDPPTARRHAAPLRWVWLVLVGLLLVAPAAVAQPDAAPAGDEAAAEGASERGPAAELVERFGLDVAAVDDPSALAGVLEQAEPRVAGLEAQREARASVAERLAERAAVLDDQIGDDALPEVARQALAPRAALQRARAIVAQASAESLAPLVADQRQLVELAAARREALVAEAARAAQSVDADERAAAAEGQQRVEQAEAAEQAALAEAEQARKREVLERDTKVRELIAERRQILEQIARLARGQGEDLQAHAAQRRASVETFTRRREELEQSIDALPTDPSAKYRRANVDPIFDTLVEERAERRLDYRQALDAWREAEQRRLQAVAAQQEALDELAETRARVTRLGATDIGRAQVALAEAKLRLRELELEIAGDLARSRQQTAELQREQITFYNRAIETVLPRISEERREAFYSLVRDENWRRAWRGVEEALQATSAIAGRRLDQLASLTDNLLSVGLWAWLFGFLWRLLLIGVLVVVTRDYAKPAVRWVTDALLRRRFFRHHARATIKIAELVRSVIRPVAVYFAIVALVDYTVATFEELVFTRWIVDAVFAYWLTMTLAKVLVLPRHYREQAGRTPAPDLAHLRAAQDEIHSVDVVNLELERALKLVRSVRYVLVFWLLEHFVPMAVIAAIGHSVITWLVSTIFDLGLLLVVYLVLTTWKDDIAALFERLAGERMPRSVEFVNSNKDRIWGVLVIGVVSIYVIVVELGRFARTYLLDTAWSKRLANFLFRKRIELQQKERDTQVEPEEERTLPVDYLEHFEDEPLTAEGYLVARPAELERILAPIHRWLRRSGGQGSIALSGERGMGKTTLLIQAQQQLLEAEHEHDIALVSLADKVVEPTGVMAMLADIFGLDEPPADREAIVTALRDLPPQIVLLDDCHHLFMREIGGFAALDLFLEVVNLTDDHHFWVLCFDKYAWKLINRVRSRGHYFGAIVEVAPWADAEIQDLVQNRNAASGYNISFENLVITHEEETEDFYEIIKTANGYFRLLQDYSGGNALVALTYWKRSITFDGETLHVSLFRRPSIAEVRRLPDNYFFALTAIAQHGALRSDEIAQIINSEVGFCDMALNYFADKNVVVVEPRTRRATLTPLYFRPIVSQLAASNYLWD